jgi:uncharacterized membrane protein YadS
LRVSLLIPIVISLSLWKGCRENKEIKFTKIFAKVPFYIYAFIVAISISQLEVISQNIILNLKNFSHFLMGVSMAAIGFSIKINRATFMNLQKGLVLGVVGFFVLLCGVALLI